MDGADQLSSNSPITHIMTLLCVPPCCSVLLTRKNREEREKGKESRPEGASLEERKSRERVLRLARTKALDGGIYEPKHCLSEK
jgi:hypothetical protein